MEINIKKLTLLQIRLLKKRFSLFKFSSDFCLVYESQVPNTGIVLINGSITLLKKNKIYSQIGPGEVFGLHELFHNKTIDTDCKVMRNSELLLIQKSEMIEALSNTKSDLYPLFKEHVG